MMIDGKIDGETAGRTGRINKNACPVGCSDRPKSVAVNPGRGGVLPQCMLGYSIPRDAGTPPGPGTPPPPGVDPPRNTGTPLGADPPDQASP